ncbi:MAG: alpha/beta hydrolase [Nitrososphaerota archaeon]|nr:alpha/beta hydrolase [Nitrososphaerota archaeon]MDG6939658.1 alpha/beta hydrolase [Nitrososphaerota archaeon]
MERPRTVVVDGAKTRYFEAGRGPPMVLFHGGGVAGAAEDWAPCFGSLSKRFHVFAFDQLGLGHTDKPKGDFGLDARVRHASGFVQAMGVSGAHLVGHSQGGYLAARLALERPASARTLVICDSGTAAPMGNFGQDGKVSPLMEMVHNPRATPEYIRRHYEGLLFNKALATDELVKEKVGIACVEGNVECATARGKLSESMDERARMDLSGRLPSLRMPVLIVWGRQDPFAPLFRGLKLFELVPSADLHVFDRCGHIPMLDRTDDFNSVVAGFCASR